MNKLFNDTLFDDIITLNNKEYNASGIAIYCLMMDTLHHMYNDEFIREVYMNLNVSLSLLSSHDYKMIQYHKAKVNVEFDRMMAHSNIRSKMIIQKKIIADQEFAKCQAKNHTVECTNMQTYTPRTHDLPEYEPEEDLF